MVVLQQLVWPIMVISFLVFISQVLLFVILLYWFTHLLFFIFQYFDNKKLLFLNYYSHPFRRFFSHVFCINLNLHFNLTLGPINRATSFHIYYTHTNKLLHYYLLSTIAISSPRRGMAYSKSYLFLGLNLYVFLSSQVLGDIHVPPTLTVSESFQPIIYFYMSNAYM